MTRGANRIGRKLGYDPYYVCIENRLARTKQGRMLTICFVFKN